MKKITVFTPAYNRAHLLPRLYESLCNQTSKNFEWMIVDDGSTDSTRELVNSWVCENKILIIYLYKENGGMHTAHNMAYENCRTEYNVCVDSDDFMPENAIEVIENELKFLSSDLAGIVGLDVYANNNKIVGTCFPVDGEKIILNEMYQKRGVRGDKKIVLKTEVVRKYPKYPVFLDERFVPLDYLYVLINREFKFKAVNKVFCIVEYQSDGSSKNILKQYLRNPKGFAVSRIQRIDYGVSFLERFKNSVHLISCAIFAKDVSLLVKPKNKKYIILAIPFGVILNIYIRVKVSIK